MNEIFKNSVYFGIVLSLASYGVGMFLKKRFKYAFLNPLLIAVIITIAVLVVGHVDYDVYYNGAQYISFLLTPATICLAVPLYEKFELLKKNYKAIMIGIGTGVVASLTSVLVLANIFNLGHGEYVTFLPKSVTTAIGMGVSEELGGDISVTAAVIIVTGVIGSIVAEKLCKVFKITEPIAKGIGIGSAAHAIGTSKAMEMGDTEGAMGSLSIVVAGILTVIGASIFSAFMV